MSWDIYGNPLQRGHCEVHPHVHEEYPCSVCLSERRQHDEANRDHQAQHDMILEVEHLKMQRDELLRDMQDVLDMLINQPHAVTAANQAEDMLRLSIGTAKHRVKGSAKNHLPDTAKMVQDGWQLVPVEPTVEQFGGIARDIIQWMRFTESKNQHSDSLVKWLNDMGSEIPDWLYSESEINHLSKHVISKGTIAAIIYKAMLAAATKYEGGAS